MPHIILERSSNVSASSNEREVLKNIIRVLCDTFGAMEPGCRARLRVADTFVIGEGRDADAFVHLNIRFLPGRDADEQKKCGELLLEELKSAYLFPENPPSLHLTVELTEMSREQYFKHVPPAN